MPSVIADPVSAVLSRKWGGRLERKRPIGENEKRFWIDRVCGPRGHVVLLYASEDAPELEIGNGYISRLCIDIFLDSKSLGLGKPELYLLAEDPTIFARWTEELGRCQEAGLVSKQFQVSVGTVHEWQSRGEAKAEEKLPAWTKRLGLQERHGGNGKDHDRFVAAPPACPMPNAGGPPPVILPTETVAPTLAAAAPAQAPAGGPLIFLSYCHKDAGLFTLFKDLLAPQLRGNEGRIWIDERLEPGERWDDEIERKYRAARVVLCLVTEKYLASPFCVDRELRPALTDPGKKIWWVYGAPCDYEAYGLNKVHAAHALGSPATSIEQCASEGEKKSRLMEVIDRIRDYLSNAGQNR